MKKDNKKLLIALIIIETIMIIGLGLLLIFNNKSQNNKSAAKTNYYHNMVYMIGKYSSIYYKNTYVEENKQNEPRKATLKELEEFGFPIDNFVEYGNKEKCDLEKSYSSRIIRDGKVYIEVYYQCGKDSNYKS